MGNSTASSGRREQNKLDKLERITSAAQILFAEKGANEVTTAEVAARANVAAGTLFLYASTKGELLLLAQNASYRQAHKEGVQAAKTHMDCVPAIISLLEPIIRCNREHVENGRTYLQEVVFGNSMGGHRTEAIELMAGTEQEVENIIRSRAKLGSKQSAELAHVVMAIMFLTLSSPQNIRLTLADVLREITRQLETVLCVYPANNTPLP